MDWTREGLGDQGFKGFVPFAELPGSSVPRGPGVYVVLRDRVDNPTFLHASPAGWFKAKDPSVEASTLEHAWIQEARVIYIGKAAGGATGPARFLRSDWISSDVMALASPWVIGAAVTSGS